METHTLERLLRDHPFLQGLRDEDYALLTGCASNVRFEPGDFLLKEGADANAWYLLRGGHVTLEVHVPGAGPVDVGSVGEDDVLGWSWLLPPYRWHLDARATEMTRALALDAVCLRGKCEADHELGYELMKRFFRVVQKRLGWTRMQLIDIYKDRA